jgi:hypothetical protein
MPPLVDLQRRVRDAVVSGEGSLLLDPALLVGGARPAARLAIHRRHYETSLVNALLGKFPATAWLVGEKFVAAAARQFIREHPPQAPCIAEYGEEFPQFLAARPGADGVPYLQDFATLEWHVGHVAAAVDGARRVHASWPVDTLLKFFLTNTAPDRLVLEPEDVWIEVHGARGEVEIERVCGS